MQTEAQANPVSDAADLKLWSSVAPLDPGHQLASGNGASTKTFSIRQDVFRHSHASHAVMNGVPVPVVSRMLGHSNVRMTLRYAHLGDREIEQAAEKVGQALAELMGL